MSTKFRKSVLLVLILAFLLWLIFARFKKSLEVVLYAISSYFSLEFLISIKLQLLLQSVVLQISFCDILIFKNVKNVRNFYQDQIWDC